MMKRLHRYFRRPRQLCNKVGTRQKLDSSAETIASESQMKRWIVEEIEVMI